MNRFADACQFACALHAQQIRKGTSIPYIAHLLAVAALVWETGGDEDQADRSTYCTMRSKIRVPAIDGGSAGLAR